MKSLNKAFAELINGEVHFLTRRGGVAKRIPMQADRRGYRPRLLNTAENVIVIRSTVGYERGEHEFELYTSGGVLAGKIPGSSGRSAISPSGNLFATTNPHPYSRMGSDGKFHFYAGGGAPIGTRTLFDIPGAVSYVFTESGSHFAILMYSLHWKHTELRGAVYLFDDKANLVMAFETKEWRPLSKDVGAAGLMTTDPLARIDPASRLILVEGHQIATLKKVVHAIGFDGVEKWQWPHESETRTCTSTMALDGKNARLLVIDFCARELQLHEIDLDSGLHRSSRTITHEFGGRVDRARITLSPDAESVLISILGRSSAKPAHPYSLLIGDGSGPLWAEEFPMPEGGEAFFDTDGRMVVRRGGQYHVGKFSP